MTLFVQKIYPNSQTPQRISQYSSIFTLFIRSIDTVYAHTGGNSEKKIERDRILSLADWEGFIPLGYLERAEISTGISVFSTPEYGIWIGSLNSIIKDYGLFVPQTKIVKKSEPEEIRLEVFNFSRKTQKIKVGMAIATLSILPEVFVEIEETKRFPFETTPGV